MHGENTNDPVLADVLWHLLHRTLSATEVERLLHDAEAVEALYDYMVDTQKASEMRISQIKADIDTKHAECMAYGGDAVRQEYFRYRAERTRELIATKQFMRYLGAEMPKWRRARSEHRTRRWRDAKSGRLEPNEPRAVKTVRANDAAAV